MKLSWAIALSVVFPADDPRLPGEIARLRRLIGDQTPIIKGGVAAHAYQSALLAAGIKLVDDMHGLRTPLAVLRSALPRSLDMVHPALSKACLIQLNSSSLTSETSVSLTL